MSKVHHRKEKDTSSAIRYKERTYKEIDCDDLNHLINQVYFEGKSVYDCFKVSTWSGDNVYPLHVDGRLDNSEEAQLAEVELGNSVDIPINILTNDLHNKGLIPAGSYLVRT